MKIGNFTFKENNTFIIAELSANHNQDFELAVKTIHAAKNAGADAIKLQTYTADTITINSDKSYFQITQGTLWDGKNLYNLYQEAYTPWEWQPKLKAIAEDLDLVCFSSPFDPSAVDFLEKMNVPAYKVASFEITDTPLIEYMAKKGKPMIIATGIAEEEDIHLAIETCRNAGNHDIILLKCTSAYPTKLEEVNLLTIPDMQKRFGVMTGISDHTMGHTAAVGSVVLGGRVVEKHFILDRSMGGPDSGFSMEPAEFKAMVDAVRETEKTLGTVNYKLSDKIKKSREHSRSLFVVADIKKGEVISEKNVRSIRPGYGLHPKYTREIMGKKVKVDLERGTPLSIDMIET